MKKLIKYLIYIYLIFFFIYTAVFFLSILINSFYFLDDINKTVTWVFFLLPIYYYIYISGHSQQTIINRELDAQYMEYLNKMYNTFIKSILNRIPQTRKLSIESLEDSINTGPFAIIEKYFKLFKKIMEGTKITFKIILEQTNLFLSKKRISFSFDFVFNLFHIYIKHINIKMFDIQKSITYICINLYKYLNRLIIRFKFFLNLKFKKKK